MMTLTMFFPMSCTSPFTVASSTFPALPTPRARSFSIYGCRMPTACFMVRAVFTTCGRNIFPSPKRRPTSFMPAMSGPSMMLTAEGYCCKASPRSSARWSAQPLMRAFCNRSSSGSCAASASASELLPAATAAALPPVAVGVAACSWLASSVSRSAASGRRFSITSSIRSSCCEGMSS